MLQSNISAKEANVAPGSAAFEVPINHLTKKASAQEVIPSGYVKIAIENGHKIIEIVSFLMKNGDVP